MAKAKKKQILKLKVDLFTLCDFAFKAEGGKLSIIGAFNMIGLKQLPSNHPEMFVVAVLRGEEGSEHKVKLEIKDPTGEDVVKNIPTLTIKLSGTGTSNMIHRLFNFPFKYTGDYHVSILDDDTKLAETKLNVIRVQNGKNKTTKPN